MDGTLIPVQMEWPILRSKRLMLGRNDQFFDLDGMGFGFEILKFRCSSKSDFETFMSYFMRRNFAHLALKSHQFTAHLKGQTVYLKTA